MKIKKLLSITAITLGVAFTFLSGIKVNANMTSEERELMNSLIDIIKDECGDDYQKCVKNNPHVKTNNNNGGTQTSTSGDELDLAVKKLHEMNVTVFKNGDEFGGNRNIRRDEVAKMYVRFAEGNSTILNKLKSNTKPASSCYFSDSKYAWSDIRPLLTKSCQYRLFNGSKGKFMPTDNLTNGQAVIVLIRMIDKHYPENQGHYASQYMARAKNMGLLNNLNVGMYNVDAPATRGTVAKLLYRSLKHI